MSNCSPLSPTGTNVPHMSDHFNVALFFWRAWRRQKLAVIFRYLQFMRLTDEHRRIVFLKATSSTYSSPK